MPFVERHSTVGSVVRAAVQRYQAQFPEYDARQAVASVTGIGYKLLCAFIADERMPRIDQLSNIFRVTNFPEGFDHLKRMSFPNNLPIGQVRS